jgi:putative PIN family toxin of toxin-antitoxin system
VILSELGELVRPTQLVSELRDEPDNRILECADFGKADLIVTGDKEMIRQKEFKGIKIASLKEYLEF